MNAVTGAVLLNATQLEYPRRELVHELFGDQVERTPNGIALLYEKRVLTYAELDEQAERLAARLRAHGVTRGKLVGICVERSPAMVASVLAILKAGAAYVPLDPSYPPERLRHMLQDAAPEVVLTQAKRRSVVAAASPESQVLDVDTHEPAAAADEISNADLSAEDLAYVIYTSGSTGRPKGITMPHGAMVNLLQWHRDVFGERPGTRVLQFAALSFDVAFQEIFTTLCSGGTLVLLDEWVRRDVRALAGLLATQRVQRLFLPPLMLQTLADYLSSEGVQLPELRDVIAAGEQLRITPQITRFFELHAGCRLHNHYGPTEAHVVTALTLTGEPRHWPTLPTIGRPVANTRIHILDEQRHPVRAGEIGEIYIGGAQVARGYLGKAQLTAEKFVRDHLSPDPQSRLYRTGDLGRWGEDGTVEYLGRNDDQVKIRGFRVELGEVEAQLSLHPGVKEAAILAKGEVGAAKRLVVYVTLRASGVTTDELRAFLKQSLPEYMLPAAFVVMEQLPLTPTGKLDRRALPEPAQVSRDWEAPQGAVEELLVGLWSELLRVELVGRRDNFFELGGHSLLMVDMMERLRRAGYAVQVRNVFESPTLADLAATLATNADEQPFVPPANLIPERCAAISPEMLTLIDLEPQHIERIAQSVAGGSTNIQDIYPLGPLQEGILFHHVLNRAGGDTYVLPTLLRVDSRTRLDELVAALQAVVDRHDVLRTAVLWEQLPRAVQVVWRRTEIPLREVALDAHRDVLEQVRAWLDPKSQQMDLQVAPLLQLRVAADPHSAAWYVLLQLHHIVTDHVTFDMIAEETVAYLNGQAHLLPPSSPYRDHVAQALNHARGKDAEAFFRHKLGDVDEPTAPFGLLDVYGDGSDVEDAHRRLDSTLARLVRAQARRFGVTAATLFHAAWSLVVAATSGRDDVVFGSLLLGRMQGSAGAERVFGMFINTLPLRIRISGLTARQLIEHTHRELAALVDHEQAPLALAQRSSGVEGTMPLFNTLLNYVHGMASPEAQWSKADGVRALAFRELTNYPITMLVHDLGEEFVFTAQTDRRIGPQRIADYLQCAIESLAQALRDAPETSASLLPVLPAAERQLVVETFNATHVPFPHDKLLHELFEEQVARTPSGIALVYEREVLTYAELNARANQLARYLRGRGVGPDQLIGICIERGFEMVIGLLAILKAGGAYVPLDPRYPPERLEYMLRDAAPTVILTQTRVKQSVGLFSAETIALDSEWPDVAGYSAENLDAREIGVCSRHLAYVIYTSGSTGNPKGAMNEHRAVVNRLHWMQSQYQLGAADRVLQKTPFSFDVSVWEFFWTLLSGARLVVARPQGHQDPAYLMRLIEEQSVTTLHFVPSMLQAFLDQHQAGRCSSVRHIVCSGEELSPALQNRCLERLSQAQLSNLYGPTEAAVDVTYWECQPGEHGGRVPIGRPIANVQMYVLDRERKPVPIGVAGEIYIGGIGVGRGYLNRPELTAERFVTDPFSSDPQARLYRTGDLGRWRADGAIEYLGRNDHQVKIRGLRIELGEIEAKLTSHEDVKEAVVLARDDGAGEKRLVAYVTGREGRAPAPDSLRAHLKAQLPEYMVPGAFVRLERMPVSPNGKLDRRALPAPEMTSYAARHYEAPQGRAEELLAAAWCELLPVGRVGRDDDFFDLGGHSLLAMQVIARVQAVLGMEVPLGALFEHTQLKQLAAHVEELCTAQLLEQLADGDSEIEELLAAVASMPEGNEPAQLTKLSMEGRS